MVAGIIISLVQDYKPALANDLCHFTAVSLLILRCVLCPVTRAAMAAGEANPTGKAVVLGR